MYDSTYIRCLEQSHSYRGKTERWWRQGLEGEGTGVAVGGYRVYAEDDGKALEMDGGDGGPAVCMCLMPQNSPLKNG